MGERYKYTPPVKNHGARDRGTAILREQLKLANARLSEAVRRLAPVQAAVAR